MDNDDSTYILEDEPEEPGRVDLSALPVAQPVVQKPRRLGSFPLPNSVPTERPPGASSDGSWQGNEPELAGGFVRGEFIDNEYKVIDFMGAGGAGGVYLVEHRRLKQSFALKVLHGSAAASEKNASALSVRPSSPRALSILVLSKFAILVCMAIPRANPVFIM